MTWGQTDLHQYGQHNACAVRENSYTQEKPGGKTGRAVAGSAALAQHCSWREWKQMEVWDLHSSSLYFRLCSAPRLCHLHWKMIPASLLQLYDSLGLIGTDKLWRGAQRYAWIDNYTAQITHTWHECAWSDRHRYCSASTLFPHWQF